MKLSSFIKEMSFKDMQHLNKESEEDLYDILKSKRHDINVDFGPRTYSMLQQQMMLGNEAYVKDWLEKNAFIEQQDDWPPKDKALGEKIKSFIKKEIDECWKTYKQVGMKKKGNKMVPNCVPKNEEVDENLRNWFKKEKWKRIDTQGNIAGDCGTMPKGKKTQRCLPQAKAQSLTKKQRAATSRKKTKSNKQFVSNTKAAK